MTTLRLLPMADLFWLAAHDSPQGKSVLRPEALSLGLSAALLSELVYSGWITVENQGTKAQAYIRLLPPGACAGTCGHVKEQPGCPSCSYVDWDPGDEARREVLTSLREFLYDAWMRDQNRPPVQDLQPWLRYMQEPPDARYLSQPVTDLVEGRLEKNGLVRSVERGLVKRRTVREPANSADAGAATKTISNRFQGGSSLGANEFLLTGLVFAVGLDASAFDLLRPASRDELKKRALLALPEPFQLLLLNTQVLHTKSVMIR
jgi:hypothetical protein